MFELLASSEAGRHLTRLAEEHGEAFAKHAERHDLEGSFPHENFEALRASGFLSATIPRDYGGLGIESVQDISIAMSRLARGDASTAIAANMHVSGVAVIVRLLRRSQAQGDAQGAATLEVLLAMTGGKQLILCFPTTEMGTDLTSPMTEATPSDGGYVINGRKIFGTTSPSAHLFFPSVRVPRSSGDGYLTATAMVARTTPGLEVKDGWDALGMRSSGSNDVVFTNCFVPENQLFAIRDTYGQVSRGQADVALFERVPLISTFMGIAEAARDVAVQTAAKRKKGPKGKLLAERVPIQQLIAEIEIDLSVIRAMIDRLGRGADAYLRAYPRADASQAESHALLKEVQCMKYVVNRKAIDVVDRAMNVCGGGAFMRSHVLSRLYRDVRAGLFMQPFAPYEALEFIGRVAFGMESGVDR